MRLDVRTLMAVLVLAAVSGPLAARGSDGVLEISQACVETGCFSGDTAGFPVTLSAAGSYRLTSNLDLVGTGTAVSITADGVDLDLGGFTIDNGGRCTGTPVTSCAGGEASTLGIVLAGSHGRVRNGVVRGFNNAGIRATDCESGCIVERVTVTDCGADAITVLQPGTSQLTFRNVDLVRNGDEGFDVVGGAARLVLEDSRVVGNAGFGMEGMTKSTLLRSQFGQNGLAGVSCSECAMAQCSFFDNAGSDVAVQFSIPTLRDMGGNVCDDGTCP
jgi:hypothetical protein